MTISEDTVVCARKFLEYFESGNEEEAKRSLELLYALQEHDIICEVGKLTRGLHDAINGFHIQEQLANLAVQDIPDAKERLHYVIDMTNKSAHTVLDIVEENMPVAESIGVQSRKFLALWKRFMNRDMQVGEFRDVVRELEGFFTKVDTMCENLKSSLNDVTMAQDFQDITSQIIRRVIDLVQEVEDGLVHLIKITGARKTESVEDNKTGELQGPAIPALTQEGEISGQDDVDELLSSLGF